MVLVGLDISFPRGSHVGYLRLHVDSLGLLATAPLAHDILLALAITRFIQVNIHEITANTGTNAPRDPHAGTYDVT